MQRSLFLKLYHDARNQPDLERYIAEFGYPDYFDEIADNPADVIEKLTKIHRCANMTLREIIGASGMSQSDFARYFDIHLRTVQKWALGERNCPEYVRLMFLELFGLLKV